MGGNRDKGAKGGHTGEKRHSVSLSFFCLVFFFFTTSKEAMFGYPCPFFGLLVCLSPGFTPKNAEYISIKLGGQMGQRKIHLFTF